MTSSTQSKRSQASVQVIGIHVGGFSSPKSALVRARCVVGEIRTGISDPNLHSFLCTRLQESLEDVRQAAAGAHFEADSDIQVNSPLFWEAYSSELGPTASADADTQLIETIKDFGGGQIFCLDAPITFPSCTTCPRVCHGVNECPEPPVKEMLKLWHEERESEIRRPRMPPPHTERYFEAYARSRYEHPSTFGNSDLESVLSSNKAPVSARAHHLARRIKAAFPLAIVVETHPWLAAAGWSLHSGYRLNHLAELKQPDSGKVVRAGLLRKLELSRTAMRSANFIDDLFLELSDNVGIFAAAMAALSGWGLVNGLCDIQRSFVQQGLTDPLQGWALVPRELATYGWGH
ncbi:MAG: hypothetical protein EBR09_08715 [Proteobacteria bacterium]|nr:hypothetical protein [Pseudomonadota bacterium]